MVAEGWSWLINSKKDHSHALKIIVLAMRREMKRRNEDA